MLSSQMTNDLWLLCFKDVLQGRVTEIHLMEAGLGVDILHPPPTVFP